MAYIEIMLAKQRIGITYIYPSTRDFLKDYIYNFEGLLNEDIIKVNIKDSDIQYESEISKEKYIKEGIPIVNFPNEYLETLAIYRQISEKIIDKNILLFHGSIISVDEEGYLFTAKSGTGKSTHTRLWCKVFSNRAIMVNDDKPLLEVRRTGVTAHGTPWNGKHHLGCNISVPLKALCILNRSLEGEKQNIINRITKKQAYVMLVRQAYKSKDIIKMGKILKLIEILGDTVPIYELYCNMELEAVQVAYKGMQ